MSGNDTSDVDAAAGAAVRLHRTKAGFTQQDIADKLGVLQSAVAKWERGQVPMRLRDTIAVCQMLGIGLDALWAAPDGRGLYNAGIQRGIEMSRQALERLG